MRKFLMTISLVLAASAPAWAENSAKPAVPAATAAATAAASYNVDDTPIGDILDDPAAAAIVDKYVPGFSANPETELARGMTLRMLQPYAADTFTDAVYEKLDKDFAALAKGK